VQDITSLFDFSGPGGNLAFAGNDKLPLGFVSAVIDSNELPIGPVSEPIYLQHSGATAPSNTAPVTSGINNVTVTEGAPDTVISLFDAFADAESTDAQLTYSVTNNSTPGLFDAVAIDPITGELTLDYAATGRGSSNITINAADPEGLSESTTFSVTVNSDGGGGGPVTPPGDAIRIEAENYRPGTNGVEYSDADAGNRGNAAGFTDDVDVETTSDTTGEFNINFIKNNEYLTYDVNIPTAGSYDLVFRVATNRTGPRKLDVTVGGQSYTATFVAAPGGFDGWQDVVISDVTFAAGNQVVRTDFTRGFFDFNYFDIVPAGAGAANTEPTTSGINDVAVLEGAGNTVINLFDSFDDTQSADNELTYSITGNSAPNLFDAATIDPITGQLTLDYAPTGTGSSNLTIEAQDPEGLSTSTSFSVTVSDPNANTAPTTIGIPDITVEEGASNTIIDVFEVFDDAQSVDTALSFAITGNTNPALFDSVTLDSIPGVLTLDYTAAGTGSSEITIEAEDPEGLKVSTSFTVNVSEPAVPGSAIRIEAENYRPGTNGVEYSDADAGNRGNAAGFTDDVDVEITSDTAGEFNINFIKNDEYLTYDVNMPTAGTYDLVFRVATNRTGPRKLD
ncbi:MAG: carbohydrate-binding domain-containing protein, partial [Cyanobacteria bacterium J06607_13]